MSAFTKEDAEHMEARIIAQMALTLKTLSCATHAEKIANVESVWPRVRSLENWRFWLLGAGTAISIVFTVAIALLGLRQTRNDNPIVREHRYRAAEASSAASPTGPKP